MEKSKITLGLIVGNRGFFPGHLAELGRAEMVKVLQESGVDVVVLDVKLSNYGAIETYEEAMRCAELFRANSDRMDGVVVTLPNFGDERAIADTHAPFAPESSRARAGHARYAFENDHRASPRQFLWKNVRVQ